MQQTSNTQEKPLDQIIKQSKMIHTVKGMNDILPKQEKYWRHVYQKVEKVADEFLFRKIDFPVVEKVALFERSIGKHTDIVTKEMFSFHDKGRDEVVLRPEFTASMMRSYLEAGMFSLPQPVKLFTYGPCYRYENPQKGRLREFHQIDFEIIGEGGAGSDAYLIYICNLLLKELKIDDDIVFKVNSLGCENCREDYIQELKRYYRRKRARICRDCKVRIKKNPLRVLDCKESKCQDIIAQAPKISEMLCEDCTSHYKEFIEYLKGMDVIFEKDDTIVRGLDYYTKTAFEIFVKSKRKDEGDEREKEQEIAVGGGGRYDHLAEVLGSFRMVPATGFALGVERLIEKIKLSRVVSKLVDESTIDFYLAQIGYKGRSKAFELYEKLRKMNIRIAEGLEKDELRRQLKLAHQLGAQYVLIIGQKEAIEDQVILRDMHTGIQDVVSYAKIIDLVTKKAKQIKR